jgi:PPOX class probable F420-dependent enzyme
MMSCGWARNAYRLDHRKLTGSHYHAAMAPLADFLAEPRNVIIGGLKSDGRPHLSPNWFFWDGERFYVSTTGDRVKYKMFRRDPRVELIIDDSTRHRYVSVSGHVEIREDIEANLHHNRVVREKHGVKVPPDKELAAARAAEGRVLLAITPDRPPSSWSSLGVEA